MPDRFFCISMWLPAGYVNFLVDTLLKLKVTDKAIDKLKAEVRDRTRLADVVAELRATRLVGKRTSV